MTKRTVYDCDGCGAKNIHRMPLDCEVGQITDAAGDTDVKIESFDLCMSCAIFVFRIGWNRAKFTHEDGRWLCEQIRTRRNKFPV